MANELVTVVRFRTVIEEVVLPRADFDRLNTSNLAEDGEDEFDWEVKDRIDELPFQDWDWGVIDFFPHPTFGYMAFAGDVTGETDDLAFCSQWQESFPLVVDEMEMPTIEQLKAQRR